jgi:hypothetical protein
MQARMGVLDRASVAVDVMSFDALGVKARRTELGETLAARRAVEIDVGIHEPEASSPWICRRDDFDTETQRFAQYRRRRRNLR